VNFPLINIPAIDETLSGCGPLPGCSVLVVASSTLEKFTW